MSCGNSDTWHAVVTLIGARFWKETGVQKRVEKKRVCQKKIKIYSEVKIKRSRKESKKSRMKDDSLSFSLAQSCHHVSRSPGRTEWAQTKRRYTRYPLHEDHNVPN